MVETFKGEEIEQPSYEGEEFRWVTHCKMSIPTFHVIGRFYEDSPMRFLASFRMRFDADKFYIEKRESFWYVAIWQHDQKIRDGGKISGFDS